MKYTIKKNDYNTFYVEEKTRTHTGVRWLTLSNIVDECNTLEEAKQKYPNAWKKYHNEDIIKMIVYPTINYKLKDRKVA